MKTKLFLASAAFFLLLSACKNEGSKTSSPLAAATSSNSISFTVNGTPVHTSGWNISRFNMGNGIGLNVTTNMHEDKRTVMINLRGAVPGTYSLDKGASGPLSGYGDYKPDYEDLLNSYRFEKGAFVIHSIDTAKGLLVASFSGTVKKGDESLSITEGKIASDNLRRFVQTY